MVNEEYAPSDSEDAIMAVLADEGRANPFLIREQTGLSKQVVNQALSNLTAAGWVEKRTRGLYDYVEDPRADTQQDADTDHQ